MTHRELAKLIGCSSGLISHYENCKREPGFTNILAMCRVFNETPNYIMGTTNVRRVKKSLNEKIVERWGVKKTKTQ